MNAPETVFQATLRNVVFAALGPAFIMLQVGSLVFFCTELLYRGQYQMPVHWVFGLFVFAIVLISRISIEAGFERASLFGLALLIAVTFVTGIGPHTVLLGIAWWAASKLTWDCTFVDTSRDVTGQGLIRIAEGRWRHWLRKIGWLPAAPEQSSATLDSVLGAEGADRAADRAQLADPPSAERRIQTEVKRILWDRRSTNTPGLWAFYFFLAGLPIFGLGQWFARPDVAVRSYCVRLFAVYMFSGLALMMLISLIGLTRYAASRSAVVSDPIARGWLIWGTAIAAAVVLALVVLPWPSTQFSLTQWWPQFQTRERIGRSPLPERGPVPGQSGSGRSDPRGAPGSVPNQPATREGTGGVAGGKQQGHQATGTPGRDSGGSAPGGKGKTAAAPGPAGANPNQAKAAPPNRSQPGPPSNPPREADSAQSKPQPSGAGQSASNPSQSRASDNQPNPRSPSQNNANHSNAAGSKTAPAESQRDAGRGKPPDSSVQRSSAANAERSTETTSPPSTTSGATWLQNLLAAMRGILQWLIWIVVAAGLLLAVIRYRRELASAVRSFFVQLAAWWAGWRRPAQPASADPVRESQESCRKFASFRNPFQAGGVLDPEQVIRDSFEACEALAREFGMRREPRETPHEFAQRVERRFPSFQGDAAQLADLYSRLAYSGQRLPARALEPLRRLWTQFQTIHQSGSSPNPHVPAQV